MTMNNNVLINMISNTKYNYVMIFNNIDEINDSDNKHDIHHAIL